MLRTLVNILFICKTYSKNKKIDFKILMKYKSN